MLEIQGLSKNYGSVQAVREVSLTIQEGEFFSLLGPSGCGKTSLLRMLGGFERPTAGRIVHLGRRVDELPPHLRQFNTVFQRYALFPHLSVRQNVAFGLEVKRVPRFEVSRRVEEALALVRLEELGDRSVKTLSGGQSQRVALARALVNRPQVLLLDEPLSALDLKLREQMQVELLALQRRLGHTFIFVTHDQEEALTMSDRIAVMNEGRLEQVGPAEEIYKRPATSFVAGFIGTINTLEGSWKESRPGLEGRRSGRIRLGLGDGGSLEVNATPEQETAARSAAGSADRPIRVLVRPEKVRIGEFAGEGWNRFAGTIGEILYQGPVTRLVIHAPALSQKPWIMTVESTSLDVGQAVEFGFHPADCVLMGENGQAL